MLREHTLEFMCLRNILWAIGRMSEGRVNVCFFLFLSIHSSPDPKFANKNLCHHNAVTLLADVLLRFNGLFSSLNENPFQVDDSGAPLFSFERVAKLELIYELFSRDGHDVISNIPSPARAPIETSLFTHTLRYRESEYEKSGS